MVGSRSAELIGAGGLRAAETGWMAAAETRAPDATKPLRGGRRPWMANQGGGRGQGEVVAPGAAGSPRGGHRVDDTAHLGDLARGQAAQARVLVHRLLALGDVDAERLVVGDEGLHPLDPPAEPGEGGVGGAGGLPELGGAHAADARDLALYDVALHGRAPV